MNKSVVLGFLAVNGVFVTTILIAIGNVSAIFDIEAIVMVIGGTITASFFSYSFTDVGIVIRDCRKLIFTNHKDDKNQVIEDIIELAKARRKSDKEYTAVTQKIKEPFLKDVSMSLFWAESETSAQDYKNLLEIKASTYTDVDLKAATTLKAMVKFPPAFGLMGTVLGLVAMLSKLNEPSAKSQIGPSMAIALMTTLYGISLNNLLIIPFSEHLNKIGKFKAKRYDLIIEGMIMIQEKKPVNYIKEKLYSYLTLEEKSRMPK